MLRWFHYVTSFPLQLSIVLWLCIMHCLSFCSSTVVLLDLGRFSVSCLFTQSVGLLRWGISPSQSTAQTENKQTDIHALSGIGTHDPSVWAAGEDVSHLRPRGHWDQLHVYNALVRLNFSKLLSPRTSLHLLTHAILKELKNAALCYRKFVIGTCHNKYDDVSDCFLATLPSRWRLPHASFVTSLLKGKLSCSSISVTIGLRVPIGVSRGLLNFWYSLWQIR
jgi:hypothetical protein